MRKYEYVIISAGGDTHVSTEALNAYGAEGYRLVATELSMGYTVRYILERVVNDLPPTGGKFA